MAWKRSGVRFSLAPRETPGHRPGVLAFSGSRRQRWATASLHPRRIHRSTTCCASRRSGGGTIVDERFESGDREANVSTGADGGELLSPDESVDRRSADG